MLSRIRKQNLSGKMFLIIWHFETDQAHAEAFERTYGSGGVWAKFFRQAPGYVRTELARDRNAPCSYFTLDYWKTGQDFLTFKNAHAEAYLRLDQDCAALTLRETKIGEFNVV